MSSKSATATGHLRGMWFLTAAPYLGSMMCPATKRKDTSCYRRVSGRLLGGLLLGTLILMIPADYASHVTSAQAPGPNPIVLENQQPGTSDWLWSSLVGNDEAGQIKGYGSTTSVKQNETITFHISVNPAQNYTIDIYRMGWYGGLGARHRLRLGPLNGTQQPPCTPDPNTGMIACNWAPAYTLTVPSDWTSGIYTAKLTNDQGYHNYVMFVVRDGRPAAFLHQSPVTTDHAYNNYPDDLRTGKSLYNYNSYGPNTAATRQPGQPEDPGEPRAVKVSFDRPLPGSGFSTSLQNWELSLVRWIERSGYDVTYSTNLDTHTNGSELLNHKAFFSVPHDEYWSKEMFDAVEFARDSGVHLAFFGANSAYTQVRFEPSAAGVPNRVMVCYRYPFLDPANPGPTTTTEFRKPPVHRPEQTLSGIMYSDTLPNTDYVVSNSGHWVYAGTGFEDGDKVTGIVGYEADAFFPNFAAPNSANHTLLSQSPFTDGNGATRNLHSSIYQAPSGAWVFASGTMSWSWALDSIPGPLGTGRVDARIQRATANILNRFLIGGPPTIASFTPTSGSVGSSVSISGTGFTGATAVRFNGTTAIFTVVSDAAIQATVPAGATSGPLSVTTPGGTATSANSFAVAPTITNFTPTSGLVGASVTISGTNFTGATAVRFNGTAANFTVPSETVIQATVPAGATTGPLSVTTPAGTGTSGSAFTVKVMLTVQKTGLIAGGTVISSPSGINCGGTCSAAFNSDSAVTLTATPALLSIFNGWSGCDSVSGNTCTVTMSGAKTVTAHFLP
jgi:hypothetical protein